MKLLMIDNYDSFTYNLVQYLGELGAEVDTHRNDAISLDDIRRMNPDGIVLSPGPCTPAPAPLFPNWGESLRVADPLRWRSPRPHARGGGEGVGGGGGAGERK